MNLHMVELHYSARYSGTLRQNPQNPNAEGWEGGKRSWVSNVEGGNEIVEMSKLRFKNVFCRLFPRCTFTAEQMSFGLLIESAGVCS